VTNSDLEAGYAADSYARVRGLSAVAMTYGPGTLSIVNAIAGAYVERSPIVVVNCGPSQTDIDNQNATGVLYSHSIGAPHTDMDIFRNITTFCDRANSASAALPQLVDNAIAAALIRKHPVYIEIPREFLDKPCPRPVGAIDATVPAGAADAAAVSILQELAAAKNPLLIVGEEVQRYRLADTVRTVLDRLQLKWATTLVAKTLLLESDPHFVGVFDSDKAPAPLQNLIRQSGLIVALGAVFGVEQAHLMIQKVNTTIRAWDGVVVSRGGPPQAVGLPALVDALDRHSAGASAVTYAPDVADPPSDPPAPAGPELTYQQVFDVIAEPAVLDESLTVIADTFLGMYPAAQMHMPVQDSFITCGLWASIGHSVGAAVGAFEGGRRPLVLIGDGGFQMIGQAVSTMVRHQHNSIVVIIANSLYGIEQYLLGRGFYTKAQPPLPYNVWQRGLELRCVRPGAQRHPSRHRHHGGRTANSADHGKGAHDRAVGHLRAGRVPVPAHGPLDPSYRGVEERRAIEGRNPEQRLGAVLSEALDDVVGDDVGHRNARSGSVAIWAAWWCGTPHGCTPTGSRPWWG